MPVLNDGIPPLPCRLACRSAAQPAPLSPPGGAGPPYLFVTHDLDVARHISQRTAVLYLGRVVEYAPTESLFAEPLHPYTQALVRAAPRLTTERKKIKPALTGDIPNAIDRPTGCHFHPRCPFAMPVCKEQEPLLRELSPTQSVACHLHDPAMTPAAASG